MKKYLLLFSITMSVFIAGQEGTRVVTEWGYENCIELSNEIVRVVLDPNVGGRVLVYERNGKDILYHYPAERGVLYEPFGNEKMPWTGPSAGRFDVGPEGGLPQRQTLWVGSWSAEITGPREARMTSQVCQNSNLQLIREFKLDEKTSHLICTQTMKNVGNDEVRVNHWSRTFAVGNGILLAPIDPNSRFPEGYIIYGPGKIMDFKPVEEPNVRVRDGILEIFSSPKRAKFVLDVNPGWLAYVTEQNQLFIKKFDPHIGTMSAEMTGVNTSIWYYEDKMCEIEPIGPMEILPPGHYASYTEHWWLEGYDFPMDRKVDLGKVIRIVSEVD
jgi:hypothetical protein